MHTDSIPEPTETTQQAQSPTGKNTGAEHLPSTGARRPRLRSFTTSRAFVLFIAMQAPAAHPAAPAFGSGALHPSPTVAQNAVLENRAKTVAARVAVPNTIRAYGDVVNYLRGIPREWRAWCEAGPGVSVFGHMTPPNKEVYSVLVTPEKLEIFVSTHYVLRGKLTTKGEV